MVVGVLIYCSLLQSRWVWNVVEIQELMLYKFKLSPNAIEAVKNIYFVKGEGAVDRSTVTRCFKKFCLDCKKFDDQASLGRPLTSKIVNSVVMLSTIEANLANSASSSWRVSGKFNISLPSVVHHLHNLSKSIQNC